ncbi:MULTISPECIES: hypothetical protein [Streptomyces]|uniref:hypothetical protein n=1 Tax=Streptomyces TaxID=1883 RepID=UPI0019D20686|nr:MULTISPECIES: hypothetical protein [Streptomyces]
MILVIARTATRVVVDEAARDLMRACEDERGDLMRARHRLSKLLLRQDLLWQGTAWPQAHER